MKQWEDKYKTFVFLGPSPIDFNKKITKTDCVWNDLCGFNLKNILK